MRTDDFDFAFRRLDRANSRARTRSISAPGAGSRLWPPAHRQFPDLLDYLRPGDVLVLNDSRVIPARLRGLNFRSGGKFEVLLLEENAANNWWAMARPGKRPRPAQNRNT